MYLFFLQTIGKICDYLIFEVIFQSYSGKSQGCISESFVEYLIDLGYFFLPHLYLPPYRDMSEIDGNVTENF